MSRRRDIEQIYPLGDEAESARWVSYARHKANELAKRVNEIATLSQRLQIPNGWIVLKVKKGRRKYFIYTEPGRASYEFFTTEDVITQPFGSPLYNEGFPNPLEAYVCGKFTNVEMKGLEPSAAPLVEFCGEECPGDNAELDPTWPIYDCADMDGEALLKTPTAWQNQRAYEHLWFPGNDGGLFVTSAAGSVPGYSGIGKLSRFNYSVGQVSERFWEDIGYDLKPSIYAWNATSPSAYGAPELTEPNYYRHAATINREGITFMVMADTEGQFYFWRAGLYADGEVPSDQYVQVTPQYPAWVEKGLSQWNFNSDASRAVCCPWRETDPPLTEGGEIPYKVAENTYLKADPAWPLACRVNAKEDEPGLIEVAIDIEVLQDGSFLPTVVVVRDERFSQSGEYAVAADYLVNDERLPYAADTLVMLTYDLWIYNGDYNWLDESNWYYPDDYSAIVRDGLVLKCWAFDEELQDFEWKEVARDKLITRWDVAMWAVNAGTQWVINPACGGGSASGETITEYTINQFVFAGTISNINLKTLTWARRCQVPVNPMTASDFYLGDEYIAYNQVALTKFDEEAIEAQPAEWDTLDYVRADLDKLELWSNGYHAALDTMPFMGQSWHPKGHWAMSSPVLDVDKIPGWTEITGVRVADVVNFRIKGNDIVLTHKDLYNAAYGDTREYTYYSAFDRPETLWEGAGTFRSFGIFRDK